MNGRERQRAALHAYHDGELSRFARWRVERRLARDPEARRELDALREMRTIVGEAVGGGEPDLWDGIRAQLAVTPRPAPLEAGATATGTAETGGTRRFGDPRWAGATLVAAGLAVALFFGGGPAEVAPSSSVRWLHAPDHPTMVLQDDAEATIIWMFEPDDLGHRGKAGRRLGELG